MIMNTYTYISEYLHALMYLYEYRAFYDTVIFIC